MSWSTRITSAPKCSGICGSPRRGAPSPRRADRRRARRAARCAAGRRRPARPRRAAARAAPSPPTFRSASARARRSRARSATSSRRTRAARPECSWIIATLSKTDSCSIACSVWNVRRRPQRARRKSAMLEQILAEHLDRARGRLDEPAEDVEERRLARAVRADQAARARRERDGHVVERRDPAEADGQALDLDHAASFAPPASSGTAAAISRRASHVLRHLVGEPARGGHQHLQHADAEEDEQEVRVESPQSSRRAGQELHEEPGDDRTPQR